MKPEERNKIYQDLLKCDTLAEIFNYLANYYDLNGTINPVFKLVVVNGILAAIQLLKPSRNGQRF